MTKKHEEKHIIKPVYLPVSKLAKVLFYLKSINKTFSRWVREQMDQLIKDKEL